MIVMDLDNTLLRSDKTISDYTVTVLEKCRVMGIKTAFATARSDKAVARFIARFAPDAFIGYGGALVLANGVSICRFDIPAKRSSQIIGECLSVPGITSIWAINEVVAICNDLEFTMNPSEYSYKYDEFATDYQNSYLKIWFSASNRSVAKAIIDKFPTCNMVEYSGENLYSLTDSNATKWNAIKMVAEYYDINKKEIVAFGDDFNDLEMLQKCGVGVAMGNAIAEVKAVANCICDTNDNDGVAKWLETYGFALKHE